MSLLFLKPFNYLLYWKIRPKPFLPTAQASFPLHILCSSNSKLLVVLGCSHQAVSCLSAFAPDIFVWKCFSHSSFHFLLVNSYSFFKTQLMHDLLDESFLTLSPLQCIHNTLYGFLSWHLSS